MRGEETYRASRGAAVALQRARPEAAAASAYTIEVRFLGGLTDRQKGAFRGAADRWTRAIVGALPSVVVDGETVSGLLILARGDAIDGPGRILGQAGPTRLRPAGAGKAAFLPAKGEMTFDTADLAQMEAAGTLDDVICHEMGHVVGVGTIWRQKGLLDGAGTDDPSFIGPAASAEYGTLRGGKAMKVPVENTGGQGTRDSHWRESVFSNELMTGFVGSRGNPLSRMTVASLGDEGYQVDLTAAEPYQLPSHQEMAEAGRAARNALGDDAEVLMRIPLVLPDDSLA